jgi:hypothetical protein
VRFGAGGARHKPGSLPQFVSVSGLSVCFGGAVHLPARECVPHGPLDRASEHSPELVHKSRRACWVHKITSGTAHFPNTVP